jgi:hypothetical protein
MLDQPTRRAVAQAIWGQLRRRHPWRFATIITRRIDAPATPHGYGALHTGRVHNASIAVEVLYRERSLMAALYPGTGDSEWPSLGAPLAVRLGHRHYVAALRAFDTDALNDWLVALHLAPTLYLPKRNRHGTWKATPSGDPAITDGVRDAALALADRAEVRTFDPGTQPVSAAKLDTLYRLAYIALSSAPGKRGRDADCENGVEDVRS